jgi:exonuclease 3'-5' domain-containing protein 1
MQTTLKDILHDERISKVFFDVRNDSSAFFAHFGVVLQGIEEVQLMESASRKTTASRKFVNVLARCVENGISGDELANWKTVKQRGERLFKAENGGSNTVFNDRPIAKDMVLYCAGDVQYLPDLRRK